MGHTNDRLAAEVARYPWYHTQDLGEGVITPGVFDHRPVVNRFGVPTDLSGWRCLDVGTMDGFWAFEMERRGATEVVAIDVDAVDAMDWPTLIKAQVTDKSLDETKAARFDFVKSVFGSKVERMICSVYDLSPELGHFDLVFCGDLLLHLKDPISALERMRTVTRGRTVVCTQITKPRRREHRPVAEFDGVGNFTWWIPNRVALKRWLTAAGFDRVALAPPFDLPAAAGGEWRGHRGVATGFVDAIA